MAGRKSCQESQCSATSADEETIANLPPAIAFRLRGNRSNRDAIGAAVTIESAAGRQTRLLQAGSGFLSQHSKELFFGLGEAKGAVSAVIKWPSGLIQQVKDLPPNHRVWVMKARNVYIEPFKAYSWRNLSVPQPSELLPDTAETWLLVPVSGSGFSLSAMSHGKSWTLSAFRGKPMLLEFVGLVGLLVPLSAKIGGQRGGNFR